MYTIAVCDKVSATSIIEDYENRLTTYQNYKKINLNEIVSKDVMLNITEDKTTACPSKTVFVCTEQFKKHFSTVYCSTKVK